MIFEFFIFLFTLILGFSSFSVVTNRNPVHAVFFLILTFCLSALLLLYFYVEFLALLFIVVYVGAIAVLFLFVVMMLDLRSGFGYYEDEVVFSQTAVLITLFSTLLLSYFFFSSLGVTSVSSSFDYPLYLQYFKIIVDSPNIKIIGDLLYTFYAPVFILAGYLLLLAMLGSIMLTLKNHFHNRKQYSFLQLERDMVQAVTKAKKV